MKRIDILVDGGGLRDLESVEKQLSKIKVELHCTDIDVKVHIPSFEEEIIYDLAELQLPFNRKLQSQIWYGSEPSDRFISRKLKTSPDVLIFISDCRRDSVKFETLSSSDSTDILFIQSKRCLPYNKTSLLDETLINFTKEVSHLPYVKTTNVEKYTNLEDLFKPQLPIKNKIKEVRSFVSANGFAQQIKP